MWHSKILGTTGLLLVCTSPISPLSLPLNIPGLLPSDFLAITSKGPVSGRGHLHFQEAPVGLLLAAPSVPPLAALPCGLRVAFLKCVLVTSLACSVTLCDFPSFSKWDPKSQLAPEATVPWPCLPPACSPNQVKFLQFPVCWALLCVLGFACAVPFSMNALPSDPPLLHLNALLSGYVPACLSSLDCDGWQPVSHQSSTGRVVLCHLPSDLCLHRRPSPELSTRK